MSNLLRINSDGLEIVAETFGAGPPLVFAHGLSGNRHGVRRQLAALADRYRIVIFDQRGHGDSSPITDPARYTPEAMAEDMAAVMDALKIDKAIVGGESMGADTTLTFALRHPGRVTALLLTVPAFGETVNSEAPRMIEMAGRIQTLGLPAFLAAAREVWRNQFFWSEDVIEIVGGTFASHQSDSLATAMRTVMNWTMPDMEPLRALRCPTCVIAWPDDALHPLALAERIAALIPRAQLEVMPTLPEVFHNPALVGAIYGRYLSQIN
jgi:pimeloyl-ACP methyl ester carboxylesterase